MSRTIFKSTGTIRVQLKLESTRSDGTNGDDNNRSTSQSAIDVFFTPNPDSTVRCGGKQYAVFVSIGEGDGCLKRTPLDDSGDGVRIEANTDKADHSGLVAVAVQQTLVEVEVVEKGNSGWTLHAITMPAPCKQK